MEISILFLMFIFYSFIGWCLEMIVCTMDTKKLVNRGFLIGPVCPIYGCGAMLMILLLNRFVKKYFLLFLFACILCSVLEYFTSFIMEKMFKARWWDYSNQFLNINGRICFMNMVLFGILGVVLIGFINPGVIGVINGFSYSFINYMALLIFLIFMFDFVVSFVVIKFFKVTAESIKKDSTDEITKKVREILIRKGGAYKRLVSSFNFSASEKLIKNVKDKIVMSTKKAKDKVVKGTKKTKEIIVEKTYTTSKKAKEKVTSVYSKISKNKDI